MHAEKYHFFNKNFFLAVKMGILRGFYAEFAKIYIYIKTFEAVRRGYSKI